MIFPEIRALVAALPEISAWPELAELFDRSGDVPRPDWELPIIACRSVGGSRETALTCAAAIACLQLSIILVDDMLDDDPRGAYHLLGVGPVANMALAYQAAAFSLAKKTKVNDSQRVAILNCIAKVALATSSGQHLDIQNLDGEGSYWNVVTAKSTPFYGGALQLGALSGGANSEVALKMYDLGVLIGEIIQLEDDLEDALAIPANADWTQGRNNLLILYARTARHNKRELFCDLLPYTDDPLVLKKAQQILYSSGAVGYCIYQLITRYNKARHLLSGLNLQNPDPLTSVLNDYGDTLVGLLEVSGVKVQQSALLDEKIQLTS